MSDVMTIGPAMQVGGNTVELRYDGKIQVTNPRGRIKTLTQDEFKKQTMKNINKIEAGEDFEYKKDHKGLKIAGAAAGTVAISLGIIYRKEIGKYAKNLTFKKFCNDVKGLFKTEKPQEKSRIEKSFDEIREIISENLIDDATHKKGVTGIKDYLKRANINDDQYMAILKISQMSEKQPIPEKLANLLPEHLRTNAACKNVMNNVVIKYFKAASN